MSDANIKAQIDERRVARGIALGLPLVTLTMAIGVGVVLGSAMGILTLAAGVLLGVIALFWASLRVLSGDAALPPEIEALDRTAHGVDALASRKKMLVLALKDLENEHALGKLDDEDFEQVSSTYRTELKDVMKRIDASLEPFRAKAQEAAHSHLSKVGLAESGYRGAQPADDDEIEIGKAKMKLTDLADALATGNPLAKATVDGKPAAVVVGDIVGDVRVRCPKCDASNETDAKFCKSCGAGLPSMAKKDAP
jgi:hypothetical protein